MKHSHIKEKLNGFERVTIFFNLSFLMIFGWFFINCVFNNSNDLIHYNIKRISILSTIFCGILLLIFFQIDKGVWGRKIESISKNKKRIIAILFCIVFFGLQVFIANSFYYDIGWDAKVLVDSGEALATNPSELQVEYFNNFPNNILLAIIYKYIYYLANYLGIISYKFLLIVINILCVDIAVIVTLVIANKIFNKASVVITGILLCTLITFSPWLVVAYSDTFSMMFPVILFYLYLKIKESDKIQIKLILGFTMGVVAIVGFQIKPTVIIILIAMVITSFLFHLKSKKEVSIMMAIFLCVVTGGVITRNVYNNYISNMKINGVILNEDKDKEVPMTHFLMMGLQKRYIEDRGYLYGAWNIDDYNITNSMPTQKEKINKNLEVYVDRVKKLGVAGYIKYLSDKGNWMLSDGTFYYGGEGNFAVSESYKNGHIREIIQSYFKMDGDNYIKTANFQEAIWIIILFLIVCPIVKFKGDINNDNIFIIRLTITGITLFLLLFEGRSRYFLNHVPFFILLSSYGVNLLFTSKLKNNK